jgi:glycosyltransferase involved in cell wall biosynthesis
LYERAGRWSKLLYLCLVLLRRVAQLRHVITADAVFFRGPVFPYGPPVFERIIYWLNKCLVIDLDDAIWEPPAYVTSPFVRFMDFGWTAKMARISRHAIAGNVTIADYIAARGCPVTIIPTCIDMALHRQKTYVENKDGVIRLGWTGLKDNLGYVDAVLPALRDLSARYPLELVVATGGVYTAEGVRVNNRVWRIEEEFEYLSDVEIGLMPLEDTPRARGKCAFKALQYMGVGTPVVLSPVGMNAEVVEDGVTGFLADSMDEWREKLERLILDSELRERMGRAARRVVEERYSIDAHYQSFKRVMEKAALREMGG